MKTFNEEWQDATRKLTHLALRLARNPHDAEDLMSNTWLRAHGAYGRFDGKCWFSTWCVVIMKNLWRDELRRRDTHPWYSFYNVAHEDDDGPVLFVDLVKDPSDFTEQVHHDHMFDTLRDFASPREWALLEFKMQAGSQEEAAKAFNLPVGTVKSRMHRLVRRLNAEFANLPEGARS